MSAAPPPKGVWTFGDFEVGTDLGTVDVVLDDRRLALWNRVYSFAGSAVSSDDKAVPDGLIVAAMMEAYIKVIQPRPPGNIHAGQTLAFAGRSVRPGIQLSLVFACVGKAIKRERKWLTFGVRVMDGDALVARGDISSIWAK